MAFIEALVLTWLRRSENFAGTASGVQWVVERTTRSYSILWSALLVIVRPQMIFLSASHSLLLLSGCGWRNNQYCARAIRESRALFGFRGAWVNQRPFAKEQGAEPCNCPVFSITAAIDGHGGWYRHFLALCFFIMYDRSSRARHSLACAGERDTEETAHSMVPGAAG